MMLMDYVFEKISVGNFKVMLCGEFVCNSNHTSEEGIDQALKSMGFESREDFLNDHLGNISNPNRLKDKYELEGTPKFKVICTKCGKHLGETDEEPSKPMCTNCYYDTERRSTLKIVK